MSPTSSAVPRRRTGRPAGASAAVTRRRILDAGLKLFAQWGFDATRVKDVALKANVNAALVHHYFGDKDDLYHAVLDDSLRPLKVLGQKLLLRGLPADLLVQGWVEILSEYFSRHRDVLWLVTRECMGNGRRVRGVVMDALGPIFGETVAALQAQQQAGLASTVDPAFLVVNTLGMVAVWHTHTSLIDQVLGEAQDTEQAQRRARDQMVQLVLRGALPR